MVRDANWPDGRAEGWRLLSFLVGFGRVRGEGPMRRRIRFEISDARVVGDFDRGTTLSREATPGRVVSVGASDRDRTA